MTLLHQLYTEAGQSPWIDNLSRDSIRSGRLANMVDDGIRGVTSNPTIFQKAMTGTDAYSADFARLIEGGTVEQAFWEMATADVTAALEIFHPLYVQSGGGDGFISLEVSPRLAYDTEGTIKDARIFHERIAMPNLLVKIPATEAGVPAIHQMISEGRNINVTLIFSLDRYNAVIEAYISGLETFASTGGDLSRVHSVASFFVSRVDTAVDALLEEKLIANPSSHEVRSLLGTAAIANARIAYETFEHTFAAARFATLRETGAAVQRPLWASTSAKNPLYRDVIYAEALIGPETIDTMPLATIDAFAEHGIVAGDTAGQGIEQAHEIIQRLGAIGIDTEAVAADLLDAGLRTFAKSYEGAVQVIASKAEAVLAGDKAIAKNG